MNLIKSINIFNSENTIFFTQPEEKIIPSKSSGEFKVYFKPNKSEYYFYTDLPCQATILSAKDKKNNLLLPNISIRNNIFYKCFTKRLNYNINIYIII